MATILIIDDNIAFAETLLLAVVTMGHTASVCPNGKAGLKFLETCAVDLVVTDIVMPESDGLEVLMELRSRHFTVPIIVMSGESPRFAPLYLETGKKLGAVSSLLKPFTLPAFAEAVADALARSRRGG